MYYIYKDLISLMQILILSQKKHKPRTRYTYFHNFVFLLKRVGWFITFTVSSNCCFYLSIGDHSFQLSTFLRWEGSQSCQICNQIVVKKCLNLSSFYKWHFKKYFTPLCEKNILAFCGCTILKSLFVQYTDYGRPESK